MADTNTGVSLTDILTSLQQGVVAINNLTQSIKAVSTASSGVFTIRLIQVSS
jgi:hypothetical protein